MLLQIAGMSALSLFLGMMWWRQWMYSGWIGTPRVLHWIVKPDGEQSYDMTMIEMTVIAGIVVFAIFAFWRVLKHRVTKE